MIAISYLITAFEHPNALGMALYNLLIQTDSDFEVLVLDNHFDDPTARLQQTMVGQIGDSRFRYYNRLRDYPERPSDPYNSTEWGMGKAQGEFVAWLSDDSQISPEFGKLMLRAARGGWDLVLCDWICNCVRWGGGVGRMEAKPKVGDVDKTTLLLRRSKFPADGFPGKVDGGPCAADGLLVEKLVQEGISWGRLADVLVVHN